MRRDVADSEPKATMKYHAVSPDTPCPFCGLQQLAYKRPGHHGDVYHCVRNSGGCGRTVVHRRQKGKPGCGLTPIMNFGVFGRWQPCRLAECEGKET